MSSHKKKQDQTTFREAMAGVKRAPPHGRIEPFPKRPPAIPRQRQRDERAALAESRLGQTDTALETGEELLFLKSGHPPRVLRRLRRGYYSVTDTIDLHHMDEATARQVLLDFIDVSLDRRHSCVRVIHGKGLRSRDLPRLKIMTNRVLRKHPCVVAFASSRPVNGGTGATEVLLSAKQRC